MLLERTTDVERLFVVERAGERVRA